MEPFLDKLMAQIVYILCAVTCFGCTWLLWNRYRKTRVDLLFWSAAAFFAFTITNGLLYVDLVVFPEIDFSLLRNSTTFLGVVILLGGLIHNSTSK